MVDWNSDPRRPKRCRWPPDWTGVLDCAQLGRWSEADDKPGAASLLSKLLHLTADQRAELARLALELEASDWAPRLGFFGGTATPLDDYSPWQENAIRALEDG